ncbi:DEAD/DEAH box helicase [Pantoea sp. GCM10028869]|uniref:DEAD/DEAH box helicase n=1 Tax=Pantoea sp. GCM10028869 TaxID=3273417 RepID=UPI003616A32F
MPKVPPRGWQVEALNNWVETGYRGIVSVVTGGGKTIFALSCIDKLKPTSTLIVVPTTALLEQWWEEVSSYFDLDLDEINILSSSSSFKLGTINLAVMNTAAKYSSQLIGKNVFLIVDECHKVASDYFSDILKIDMFASLGLSATPERQYDNKLNEILIPLLGPVIFNYDYGDALKDGVIVPFELRNIVFELEPECLQKYEKVSKSIARSISQNGLDAEETVALFLKRARILNLSMNRIRLALKIVAANKGKRTLIFHEDVEACSLIYEVLKGYGIEAGIYHSKMSLKTRAETLKFFRSGNLDVLVTCRALDEGFNVPETELGIIAASTATRRQRIQRLGRVVRPAKGKTGAIIYSLVATGPEVQRLKDEEEFLDGLAVVKWSKG